MSLLRITVVKATTKDGPCSKEGKFNYPSSCEKWQTSHSQLYSPTGTTTVILLSPLELPRCGLQRKLCLHRRVMFQVGMPGKGRKKAGKEMSNDSADIIRL